MHDTQTKGAHGRIKALGGAKTMENPVIIAVSGGFYLFGDEVQSDAEGYIAIKNAAMFGGFGGGQGLPGVAGGCAGATVTLDRFPKEEIELFPVQNVFAIFKSVDLYKFKGTTIRGGK
jgi:hypothetical protein